MKKLRLRNVWPDREGKAVKLDSEDFFYCEEHYLKSREKIAKAKTLNGR